MIMKYYVGSPGFVINPIFSVKYVCGPHRDFDRKLAMVGYGKVSR